MLCNIGHTFQIEYNLLAYYTYSFTLFELMSLRKVEIFVNAIDCLFSFFFSEFCKGNFYFRSSYDKDSERTHHRVAWLRLVSCAERLLNWTKKSSLAPSSLVVAIQAALIDPALELFYPETAEKLAAILFVHTYLFFD